MAKAGTRTPAALGFRVKSGWAATVLLSGPVKTPCVLDRCILHLSDPNVEASKQPYHAAMGILQCDAGKIERLRKLIVRATERGFIELMERYRAAGYEIVGCGLVVGSDIDPAKITNTHIRAHALEGRLFRTVLEDAARSFRLNSLVLVERRAYAQAARELKRSEAELRRTVAEIGRSIDGPWRADEKMATLAAWLVAAQA